MSVVELVSRYTLLLKNPDRTSKPVMNAPIGALFPVPQTVRRSITFDRGSEFAACDYLKDGLGYDRMNATPRNLQTEQTEIEAMVSRCCAGGAADLKLETRESD